MSDVSGPCPEQGRTARAGHTYSLMRGGLVHALVSRIFGDRTQRLHVRLAVILVLASMLPIVAATLINGTFYGNAVDAPLLSDFSTLARFLIVVPLLVLAAPESDRLIRRTLAHVPRCGLLPRQKRAAYDRLLSHIRSLRDSRWPEALLLAIAITPALFMQPTFDAMPDIVSWRNTEDAPGYFAKNWLDLIGLPVFRFVVLLWLWRFSMWTYLLYRLSRLHLRLDAGHPDGSGGALFIGESQFRFIVLALAGAILVSASSMNHVVHLGESIEQQKHVLIGYVLLAVASLISPLFLLARRLFRVKQRALLAYSELGHLSATDFARRWLQSAPPKSLLDTGDSSAVADYAAVYATVRGMSIFPMTRATLVWFILVTASPFLPLFIVAMPLDDLLNRLLSVVA